MYLSRFNWRLLHSHIVWQPGCIDKPMQSIIAINKILLCKLPSW
jgi:hypothetical protein